MAKRSTGTPLMVVIMLWMALSCVAEHKAEDEYDTLKDVKEKAKSWGNWASDKSSEFGRVLQESHESKESQEVKETLGEAGSTATEMMNSAGLGTSKYALGKASSVLSEAEEFGSFGLDKARYAYNEVKRRINLAKNENSDDDSGDDDDEEHGDNGLREMVGEDKHNEPKEKEQELKNLAEESSSEDAKSSYEVAKEKVSQAAGDLGVMVRGKIEEL